MSSVTLGVTAGLPNGSGADRVICGITMQHTDLPGCLSTGPGAVCGTAKEEQRVPNRDGGADDSFGQHYGAWPVECRPESTLPELLVQTTVRCPQATALLGREGALSYAELLLRAQNIAVRLKRMDVRSGDVVAIVVHPTFQTIAAVIGILLVGGTYMPVMPECSGAGMDLALHSVAAVLEDGAGSATSLLPQVPRVNLAEIEREKMPLQAESALPALDPDSAAVLLHNGTGAAVSLAHRSLVELAASPQLFALRGAQTLFLSSPLTAPVHALELWGALLGGYTLALPSAASGAMQDLPMLLRHYRVTSLFLPVPIFKTTADTNADALAGLAQLALYGDPLPDAHADASLRWLPARGSKLRVLYSPRALDGSGYVELSAGSSLNESTSPALEHAAEAFAGALPFAHRPASDLPQGEVVAEATSMAPASSSEEQAAMLEALLRAHSSVSACAVIPAGEAGAPISAFAVLVADEGAAASPELPPQARARLAAEQLWSYAAERLPALASAARIHLRQELPRNAAGEVDRARLEAEAWHERRERRRPGRVDRSTYLAYAEQVRAIWAELLHRDDISLDEDFYAAGGSEVDMIRLHAEMNRRFPGAVTMADLPVLRTVRTLMNHLLGRVAPDGLTALERRRA